MPPNEEERKAIANRLRVAREHAGLSQGQVAKLFGYQRPTISEIEAGRRRVSAEELTRFCDLYGVSVSWAAKEQAEVPDARVELAARELAKLKAEDLEKVMGLLKTLKRTETESR